MAKDQVPVTFKRDEVEVFTAFFGDNKARLGGYPFLIDSKTRLIRFCALKGLEALRSELDGSE